MLEKYQMDQARALALLEKYQMDQARALALLEKYQMRQPWWIKPNREANPDVGSTGAIEQSKKQQ